MIYNDRFFYSLIIYFYETIFGNRVDLLKKSIIMKSFIEKIGKESKWSLIQQQVGTMRADEDIFTEAHFLIG